MTVLQIALDLVAEWNLPVFPCWDCPSDPDRDKRPANEHGFKGASRDPAIISQMNWRGRKLIGVATGASSDLAVIDIDPRHHGDDWLFAHLDRLPVTRNHATRSGGVHLLYAQHPGLRDSCGKHGRGIAPGVDIRADGGYIIWWPATGFAVIQDSPIVAFPAWVLPAPRPLPKRQSPARPTSPAYIAAAVRKALRRVCAAPEGTRNDTLNAEVYGLARLAIDPDKLASLMTDAALAAGLDPREIERTIVSALQARGVA